VLEARAEGGRVGHKRAESSVDLHFDSIGLFSDVRLEVGTAHRYDVNGTVSLKTNVYCLSEWFHFGCTAGDARF